MKTNLNHSNPLPLAVVWLQWACVLLFLGRAYQHLFWDAQYRELFWDEKLMSSVITAIFQQPWTWWASHSDPWIQVFVKFLGWIYLACAGASFALGRGIQRIGRLPIGWLPLFGSGMLGFLFFVQTKDQFFRFSMFIEHASQMLAPVILWAYVKQKWTAKQLGAVLRVAISLTFVGHGLYALGWPFPRPGAWVDMTMNILPLSDHGAVLFLKIAGSLDLVVAIGIWFGATARISLYYCIVWGALTAWARTVGGIPSYDFWGGMHQVFFETVLRAPHGLLPLFLLDSDSWGKRTCRKPCVKRDNDQWACPKCKLGWRFLFDWTRPIKS